MGPTPPARELRNRWTTGQSRKVEEISLQIKMSPPPSSSTLFSSLSPSSLVLAFLVVFVWSSQNFGNVAEARSVALPSPQCHPAVVNTMKPRIKQICKALEAIWEFSDVMEIFLDEKESEEFLAARQQLEEEAARQQRPLVNSGVKRKGEDPDHVFLRFGRRSHY